MSYRLTHSVFLGLLFTAISFGYVIRGVGAVAWTVCGSVARGPSMGWAETSDYGLIFKMRKTLIGLFGLHPPSVGRIWPL